MNYLSLIEALGRLRVVSILAMAIVGRAKYTRARKFRGDSKFLSRVCISSAPQSPSPKLETTHSLALGESEHYLSTRVVLGFTRDCTRE